MTAFVSACSPSAPQVLCRRPRPSSPAEFCPAPPRQSPVLNPAARRRALPAKMCEGAPPELSRAPHPGPLHSARGFALRDAPLLDFQTLPLRGEDFQRGGAYAIRDVDGHICYMGYSKNVAAKLRFHAQLVPHRCASFQVYLPSLPPELISPDMLESVLEYWVRENGAVPRGNTVDRHLWEQRDPVDRKVLFGSIFALFLISSIVKQVLYFTTRY